MKITETPLSGLLLVEVPVFGDDRGYFMESWNKKSFQNQGLDISFDQDNVSMSSKGVLRGLHFQAPPHAQGKLVRVLQGAVLDVAVDIRKDSETYGQHYSVALSADNKKALWIPPGFAHGFATLEDKTLFAYKCSGIYKPQSEGCLLWNDPALNINWRVENPQLSEKDKLGTPLNILNTPF
jgi:dTDP-4-dehydrorhamnose 3,5-epimerase